MNWREIITKMTWKQIEAEGGTSPQPLCQVLNIPEVYWDNSGRLNKVWAHSWICTDTRVGLAVYYLDNVPVAVSQQAYRKSDEIVSFLSDVAASQVEVYLLSLIPEAEKEIVPLADLDTNLDVWIAKKELMDTLNKKRYPSLRIQF